jgi:hypothetical protein
VKPPAHPECAGAQAGDAQENVKEKQRKHLRARHLRPVEDGHAAEGDDDAREAGPDRLPELFEGIAAKDHLRAESGGGEHGDVQKQQEPLVEAGPDRDLETADQSRRQNREQQQAPAGSGAGSELMQGGRTQGKTGDGTDGARPARPEGQRQPGEPDQQQEEEDQAIEQGQPVAGGEAMGRAAGDQGREKGIDHRQQEDDEGAQARRILRRAGRGGRR